MPPILRSMLAVIAGIVVFVVMIVVLESLNSLIYPSDFDFHHTDQEQVDRYMMSLSTGSFFIVLFGWESGAFVGGAICAWLAGRRQVLHAGIIGGAVFLATWANLRLLWHPEWMWAAGLMLPLPVSLLAGYLVMLRQEKRGQVAVASDRRPRRKGGSSNRR